MRFALALLLTAVISGTANSAPIKKPVVKKKPAVAAAAPAQPSVYYDFKGARLGMTLAEVRALPLPTEAPYVDTSGSKYSTKYGPMALHCSDEATFGRGYELYVSETEKALGVVVCAYGRKATHSFTGDSFDRGVINIGPRNTPDIDYKFMDRKLYNIDITAKKDSLNDALEGLTAKFGPPTKVLNDTTQNKAGATFPHTEQTWSNPAAIIMVEAPWSRIDEMHVSYMTAEGGARLVAKKNELHPAASKM